jgi:hypothetical protein
MPVTLNEVAVTAEYAIELGLENKQRTLRKTLQSIDGREKVNRRAITAYKGLARAYDGVPRAYEAFQDFDGGHRRFVGTARACTSPRAKHGVLWPARVNQASHRGIMIWEFQEGFEPLTTQTVLVAHPLVPRGPRRESSAGDLRAS